MKLTVNQQKALAFAFKKGGAWYGQRGSRAGGAYSRMCERMADMGLVGRDGPHGITVKGLVVLHDLWRARWARHGCMAYQMDLQEVEAALADVPHLAARAREKLAA